MAEGEGVDHSERVMERRREEVREREKLVMIFFFQRKQAEDEVMKKECSRETELARLEREAMEERHKKAEAAFSTWKYHKDMGQETERQQTSQLHRSLTPPRRGIGICILVYS